MSTIERRKAALTIARKSSVARDLRWAARAGVVVQTREAWLLGRARRAIGPVGRKRW